MAGTQTYKIYEDGILRGKMVEVYLSPGDDEAYRALPDNQKQLRSHATYEAANIIRDRINRMRKQLDEKK